MSLEKGNISFGSHTVEAPNKTGAEGSSFGGRELVVVATLAASAFLASCMNKGVSLAEATDMYNENPGISVTESSPIISSTAEANPVSNPPVERTPTVSPTAEVPTFENIQLPEATGTLQESEGAWLYNSPDDVEVGKNISVSLITVDHEDGSTSYYVTPQDHPEWPLFIRGQNSSEWIQAMRYVDVNKRAVWSSIYAVRADITGVEVGAEIPFGILNEMAADEIQPARTANLSAIALEKPFEREGFIYLPLALPLDGDPKSPMVTFELNLGSNRTVDATDRLYEVFHINASGYQIEKYSGLLVAQDGEETGFRDLFIPGNQIVIDINIEILAQNADRVRATAPGNIRLAVENSEENRAIIRILKGVDPVEQLYVELLQDDAQLEMAGAVQIYVNP